VQATGATPLIALMVARIVERFVPLRVVLFGSHARGEANAGSDIDLLVVFPQVEDRRRLTVEIMNALADLPASKDVLVATPEEVIRARNLVGSALRSALKEGKILYERRPAA
jgi:predicted nucleotidyltransferase